MNFAQKIIWKILSKILPLLDFILIPFTVLSSVWFLIIRKCGIERSYFSRKILLYVGVFPIRDHYYEPVFNSKYIRINRKDRFLPGINLNINEQLNLLSEFRYSEELKNIPIQKEKEINYYYENPSFFAGDGEYLYNIIRLKKPRKIIEIGSGFSTLMTLKAIETNKKEDTNYDCKITCIEPFEMPWLEKTGVQVIRKKVQEVEHSLFKNLDKNDILFIDSSHIIRPDGDVLFEYLEVLPTLKSGVIIHIHDIYTPKDYLPENYEKFIVFINEQYLVEAFLTLNNDFRIIAALNFLKHNHFKALSEKCPIIAQKKEVEPRSLWIMRN